MKVANINMIAAFVNKGTVYRKMLIMSFAGAFSALAFAPFYFIPAYIIALPILLIGIMTSATSRSAFKFGNAFGFWHFYVGLYWIGNSVIIDPNIPDWVGYFMVGGIALLLSLFMGLMAVSLKYLHRNHTLKSHLLNIILSFVVLWSLTEWVRGHVLTGFPWNLSGYLWGFSDVMLQSTAVWGIYGLGIVTVFLCMMPFAMIEEKLRFVASISIVLIISGLFLYGNARIPENIQFVDDVNLRLVQANIKQQDKWDHNNWAKNLITHMEMSEGKDTPVNTHVIWPETAVIYSLTEEPFRRQLISQVLESGGTVITGLPRRQRDPDSTKIFNSMVAINEVGEVVAGYDKSHLVPFGEYTPAFIRNTLSSLGFERLFSSGVGFYEGSGVKTLNIPGLPPVGVLICYEVIFPGQVVDSNNRPEWLLNLTNDAWYGDSTGPRQHLLQTRVRAIEEGLPLIRSASTGISAIIDPYGRIINEIPLNQAGVIEGRLPKKIMSLTLYSYAKEWIFACISAMLIIVNIVFIRRSTSHRR